MTFSELTFPFSLLFALSMGVMPGIEVVILYLWVKGAHNRCQTTALKLLIHTTKISNFLLSWEELKCYLFRAVLTEFRLERMHISNILVTSLPEYPFHSPSLSFYKSKCLWTHLTLTCKTLQSYNLCSGFSNIQVGKSNKRAYSPP